MLVLSRRKGQRIIIDGEIILSIEHVGASEVKVGIEAPRTVSVKREELLSATEILEAEERAGAQKWQARR